MFYFTSTHHGMPKLLKNHDLQFCPVNHYNYPYSYYVFLGVDIVNNSMLHTKRLLNKWAPKIFYLLKWMELQMICHLGNFTLNNDVALCYKS